MVREPVTKQLEEPKTPVLLQCLQWVFDPVRHLESKHVGQPDFFISRGVGAGSQVVLTSHPQAMQYILTNDRRQLNAPSDTNRILEPLIGNYSGIMLQGESHRKRRQLVMPSFHGDRLQTYGMLIQQLTHQAMAQLPLDQPFSARKVTQTISLQVIFEVVFGLHRGERADQIKHLLTQTSDWFMSPLASALLFFQGAQKDWGNWSPWGRFMRLRQALDDLLYAEIRDRRANPDDQRQDILSLLMAATDETGETLTDEELRDEIITLLFAGHETTASSMAWGLYWIHRLPEVKAKLLQELSRIDPNNPLEIARLPYLNAVCQETLRRSPVAMLTFPRVAQEPIDLLGYHFEAGTIFMGCIYLTHQRQDLYPDPTVFRPERFLERKYSPYEFIPFGGGARRCVGEALAQYELKLVLATLLSSYELELADNQLEYAQRRGVTLAPAKGVRMVLKGLSAVPEKVGIAAG